MKQRLIGELHKRNVLHVAVYYFVAALLAIQIADFAVQRFGAPASTMTAVLIGLAIGFPIALFVSWAFEVTGAGVVPEAEVDRTVRVTDPSARRVDLILLLIVVIVTVFMGLERLVFSKRYEADGGTAPVISEPAAAPRERADKGP